MVLADMKGMPFLPILPPNFISSASHCFLKNTALPSPQGDWRSLADRRSLTCLHFPQAKVCTAVIFPNTPFQCDCFHSRCLSATQSLCVVSIFLNVLCQNTPSTGMARARERMLQPPCSAARLFCILSLRGQRILFQSHRGQIHTYASTLSSYLALSLPVSFRHSCLPWCPNYPQRDRKVRFVLFVFIF